MAIYVKNLATGEVTKVHNVKAENGVIHAEGQCPFPKTRFFNNYPFMQDTGERLTCLYKGEDVEVMRLALADGYELETKRQRSVQPKATSNEPTPTPNEPAKAVEPTPKTTANVPNYIAGVPNAMINARQRRVKRNIVNVYYNIATGCNVSAEDIRKEVAKFCCALLRLEASGVRVNLYTGDCCSEGKQNLAFAVKVKDSGQPFDTLKMCYPLVHPSFLRRHYLRFVEVTKGVNKNFVDSYGRPHKNNEETKSRLCNNGIKVDAVLNYYSISQMTIEDIIKYITK